MFFYAEYTELAWADSSWKMQAWNSLVTNLKLEPAFYKFISIFFIFLPIMTNFDRCCPVLTHLDMFKLITIFYLILAMPECGKLALAWSGWSQQVLAKLVCLDSVAITSLSRGWLKLEMTWNSWAELSWAQKKKGKRLEILRHR